MFKITIRLFLAIAIGFSQISAPTLAAPSCAGTKEGCHVLPFDVSEKQFHSIEKKLQSPKGIALIFHKLHLLVAGKYRQPGSQALLRSSLTSNTPAMETRVYDKVGVIIVHDLSQRNADAMFNNLVSDLINKSHVSKLILDLRNCDQAEFANVINVSQQCLVGDDERVTVDVSGWINNHNIYQTFYQRTSDLYVRTIDRTANTINNQYFRWWPTDVTGNLSFAVITNHRTFSASEILVAALREHNRVQLFGQTTGGNCDCAVYMQAGRYVYRLRDEYFNSPNGNCIGAAGGPCQSDAGIKPDVPVDASQDPKTDPQMKAAMNWLQTQP